MLNLIKYTVPALIVIGGFWAGMTPSYGKPDYAKAEKKGCTFCHVKTGSKDLNDAGKYYQDHDHSLDGYKAAK
jgi:hypothetical protein